MATNATVASTMDEYLAQLGDISPDRLWIKPPPGTATLEDCIRLNDSKTEGLFELVDQR